MKKNNEKQAHALQMVEIDHSKFAVEIQNGNASVNLTQMAKMFGKYKRPDVWLRTQESKDYIAALGVSLKSGTADLLTVKQGGVNQGTWAHDYRIAMRFAQWLDPSFSIAVDELLIKLLTRQSVVVEPVNDVEPVIHQGKPWYNYLDILESCGFSRRSGQVSKRRRQFPQHFIRLFQRSFISPEYCHYLNSRKRMMQLSFNFIRENALSNSATS